VCYGLRRLACSAPGEVDQDVIDLAVEAMRDKRDDVRIAALQVPFHTRWTEFLPEVTRLAEPGSADRVRGFAGNAKLILELTERIASDR
jgi:hypothetical protein